MIHYLRNQTTESVSSPGKAGRDELSYFYCHYFSNVNNLKMY